MQSSVVELTAIAHRHAAAESAGYELLGEWVNELGVLQEYEVHVRYDDARVREFRVVGLLKFGTTALAGERLYADTEFLRVFFAPLWDELEVVST